MFKRWGSTSMKLWRNWLFLQRIIIQPRNSHLVILVHHSQQNMIDPCTTLLHWNMIRLVLVGALQGIRIRPSPLVWLRRGFVAQWDDHPLTCWYESAKDTLLKCITLTNPCSRTQTTKEPMRTTNPLQRKFSMPLSQGFQFSEAHSGEGTLLSRYSTGIIHGLILGTFCIYPFCRIP